MKLKRRKKMSNLNIFQRMLKATEEIGVVAKNLKVDISKTNSYKAVSERDILDAVKPIEIKHGIYSYPYSREVIETSVLEQAKKDYQSGEMYTTKQLFMRIQTIYRFVNVDKPDEYIDITSYGDGVDSQDKATGKAMTYADKYALMKAYKISTGDDPDQEASQELKDIKATPKQVQMLEKNYRGENLKKLLAKNKIEKLEDMPKAEATRLIGIIMNKTEIPESEFFKDKD